MSKYLPDIRQGDTYRIKIQYPAGTNVFGYTHWLTLRTDFDTPQPALQIMSLAGDNTDDNPTSGLVYLEAAAEVTTQVAPGSYVWDVQARSMAGEIITLMPPVSKFNDKIAVVPQVTK